MKLRIKVPEDLAAENAAREAQAAQSKARAFLDSTDWMVVRQTETGTPIPQAVLKARAKARAQLSH